MHVVVTGASSGIGEAIAREFMARDHAVTLLARRRDLLEAIAKSAARSKTHVVQADLADPDAVCGWIDDAEKALGPIDVLVNNAGLQIVKHAHETTWEEAERLLRVDLHAPLRLTGEMLKRMIPRRKGCIVDIASMAAIAPTPGMFFYNAAKAGLAAASEGLRAEVRRHGIHVVTVYPGPVESAMELAGRNAYEESVGQRLAQSGTPETLARLVVNAVAKRRPRVIYPSMYAAARHFPNATRWALDALTPPLRRGV